METSEISLRLGTLDRVRRGLTKLAGVGQEVDLAEDVDVRQLHLQHRPKGEKEQSNVFACVGDVVGVHEVHRGELSCGAEVSRALKCRASSSAYL